MLLRAEKEEINDNPYRLSWHSLFKHGYIGELQNTLWMMIKWNVEVQLPDCCVP
jgi:hypothetical protein